MAQHLRYDKDGNKVYFNHAVDAREGVQMGFFFETPPEKEVEKEPEKIIETKVSKRKAPEKEVEKETLEDAIIEDDIKIENINLDDEN